MIPRYGHPTHPPGETTARLGPDKDDIPTACHLASVSQSLCDAALDDLARAGNRNDLGDAEVYPVSKGVTLDGYRQVLLQRPATTGLFERDYTEEDDQRPSRALACLRALPPFRRLNFYRARLLVLDAGREVPWHVDTAPREFCRIHIMAEGEAHWRFRRRGEELRCAMKAGEVWWTSVGWPHAIRAGTEERRVVLTLHANWHDMVAVFGDPRESAAA